MSEKTLQKIIYEDDKIKIFVEEKQQEDNKSKIVSKNKKVNRIRFIKESRTR